MTPDDMLRLARILREKADESPSDARVSRSYRQGFSDGYRSAANIIETLSGAPADAQRGASEVAEVDVMLPCGCVPPCEGHHEDES